MYQSLAAGREIGLRALPLAGLGQRVRIEIDCIRSEPNSRQRGGKAPGRRGGRGLRCRNPPSLRTSDSGLMSKFFRRGGEGDERPGAIPQS